MWIACGKADAAIAQADSSLTTERGLSNHDFDDFLPPGRGCGALRRAAILFLRLLAMPPLRPLSRFARRLASLHTNPPNLPGATA